MAEEQQNLLQKLYVEQQLTENNIKVIRQQVELTQVLLTSYQTGLKVLKEIESKEEGEEMLLNVGANVFIRANLIEPTKVTRALGSGVRIEQSREDALNGVEQAVENLGKQYDALIAELEKMINRQSILDTQMRQLASQIQSQGAQ
ncbi:MAG: prefoldin subunit alpha [Candidatus Thorarchaeota archaeon]